MPAVWPELSEETHGVVLDACAAVLTVRGTKPLQPNHRRMLSSLAEHVFVTPHEPEPCVASDLPARLGDPETQRQVLMVLLMLVVADNEIDRGRLQVVREIGKSLGFQPEILDDLVEIQQHHVLRARICIIRRTFRDLYHRTLAGAVGAMVVSSVFEDADLVARYRALEQLPEGSFGRALFSFYEDNEINFPGQRGPFAPSLTCAHDARHVLSAWDASFSGELSVAAFESGLSGTPQFDNVMAILLHGHVGVEIYEPTAPVGKAPVDIPLLVGEMARGAKADRVILESDFDFWAHVERPLDEVRAWFHVPSGGRVHGDVKWCGPDGLPGRKPLPLDRMTVLPQTRGQTIAIELHGSLSAEDIEALGQLFARRTWNDRKVDLFVELGEDAGYADAAAVWTDLGMALRNRNAFRRIAVVGTSRWHSLLVQLDRPFAKMFGADERYFEHADRDAALAFVEG